MEEFQNDYTISSAEIGSAQIKKISLAGWSEQLPSWTDQGRLYWKVTTNSELELYRKKTGSASDLAASGAIVESKVTLDPTNGSNISGSSELTFIPGEESHGYIIVSYSNENDLMTVFPGAGSFLDDSNKWQGGHRFELAFKAAKHDIDARISKFLDDKISGKNIKNKLASLSSPRELARIHAYETASVLQESRSSFKDFWADEAKRLRLHSDKLFRNLTLSINADEKESCNRLTSFGAIKTVRA